MDATDTEPRELPYSIEEALVVAQTPELRVSRLTLAEGQLIPWHYHSNVEDRMFCLEGELEVETRAPRATHRLSPGDDCTVPPKTAHMVSNVGQGRARFVLVQGVGAFDFQPVGG